MRAIALLGAVAVLCGCESIGRLDSSTAPPANHTVFVIGMKPEAAKLGFAPGRIKDGAFQRDPIAIVAFAGKPENGYIVGRAKSGDMLALETLTWLPSAGSVLAAPSFWACGGRETLVFDTPKDAVLYLGDLEYDHDKRHFTYRSDIEQAREFIDKHHPALKGRLVPHGFKVYPAATGCLPLHHRSAPVSFSRAR